MNRKAFAALMMVMTACMTTPNHKSELDTWIGTNVDELVKAWGPATKEISQESGGKTLEFTKSEHRSYGGGTVTKVDTTYAAHGPAAVDSSAGSMLAGSHASSADQLAHTDDPKDINWYCTTQFTVNADGVIVAWGQSGNDCKATPPRYSSGVPVVDSKSAK